MNSKVSRAEAAEVQGEPQLPQDSGFSPFTLRMRKARCGHAEITQLLSFRARQLHCCRHRRLGLLSPSLTGD